MRFLEKVKRTFSFPKKMMGLTALGICAGMYVSGSAHAEFSDFNKTQPGGAEVFYLYDRDIINGYPDGTFRPESNVRRGQAVVMLGRVLKWDISQTNTSPFKDVPANSDDNRYIIEAAKRGIVSGYDDGTFRPYESLTRGQMSAILQRVYKYPTHFTIPFVDVKSTHWAYSPIQALASNGIVTGYTDNTFKPQQYTSRKHYSMMLARTLQPSFKPPMYMKVKAGTTKLDVHGQPNTTSTITGALYEKALVQITPTSTKGWVKINYKDITGYAPLSYLEYYRLKGLPLEKRVVVVDAGHGGTDSGAVYGSLVEKDINLKASYYLKTELEKRGATVYLSRPTDTFVTLNDRATFSSPRRADIFISIHANATTSHTANGTETYYNDQLYEGDVNPYPEESKKLAYALQVQLDKLPTKNLGIKQNEFYVLRKNTVPAVLVELGFIDGRYDSKYLADSNFLRQSAVYMSEGVVHYFN
jgi:N-acetylmuramoyl-L-alanine amidase